MDVRMPDGVIVRNVPDGTPKEELLAKYERSKRMAALPQSMANIKADEAQLDPTGSTADRFWAGAGKAVVDLGRGAGQLVGAVSNEDIAQSRALDAPLMATTAGKVGNFAGNVAAAAPAAFVPGANTVAGAGVVGAGLGLLQPAESAQERVINTAVGGAAGAVGQKVGQVLGEKVGSAIAGRTAAAAEAKSANAVRDATLEQSRRLGYVVPPSTPNPTVANRVVESVSGKAATQQSAMVRNQQVTNRLVREELGLPKGAPLTVQTLGRIRERAGTVYRAIKGVGDIATDDTYLNEVTALSRSADEVAEGFPDLNLAGSAEIKALQDGLLREKFNANSAIEAIKSLRSQASKNLAWNVEDPAKKALGLAQREAAGIIEDQVVRHLQATGKGQLAQQFDSARRTIAKTYSIQAALNEGSGNVVATKLVTQLRKGKPLSGRLESIAKFASAFPKAAGEQTTSAGVSAVDALVGAGLGTTVDPTLFGIPLARMAARGAVLSKPYQAAATVPSYAPNNRLLQLMQQFAPLSSPVAIGLANTE
jgi:hypothetical protein